MDLATLCFMATGVAVLAIPVVAGLGLLHVLRETSAQIREDSRRHASDRLLLLPDWSKGAEALGLRVIGPHHMEGEAVGRPVRIRRQDAWLTVELVVPETRLEAALREEPTPGVVVTRGIEHFVIVLPCVGVTVVVICCARGGTKASKALILAVRTVGS